MRQRERLPLHVTIVAMTKETLVGLERYLTGAGVRARGTRKLAGIDDEPCSAVVVFPDEFDRDDVLRELHRLRRERPAIMSLVVTREPHRFAEVIEADAKGPAPVVLPKPAWGWTILDAIRARLDPGRQP